MNIFTDAEFISQVADACVQITLFAFLSYGLVKIRNFIMKHGL